MKLYVSADLSNGIEGYANIPIVYGDWDLDAVVSSSAAEILVISALDHIPSEKSEKFLQEIVSKLRMGAIMTITGLDLGELARSVHTFETPSDTACSIIGGLTAVYRGREICQKLKQLGLQIVSYTTKGLNYEIKATR